jgi:hypothetical protein
MKTKQVNQNCIMSHELQNNTCPCLTIRENCTVDAFKEVVDFALCNGVKDHALICISIKNLIELEANIPIFADKARITVIWDFHIHNGPTNLLVSNFCGVAMANGMKDLTRIVQKVKNRPNKISSPS